VTSPERRTRLALLTHDVSQTRAGVRSVVAFLHRVAVDAGFEVELLSAATTSRDEASVRILSPASWIRAPRLVTRADAELGSYVHSGASFAELEFRRYRPRRALTRLLDRCALIQVVAGIPAWGSLARDARAPVALQCASLVRLERASALGRQRGARRAFGAAMASLAAREEERALARADLVLVENRVIARRLESGPAAGRVALAPPGVDVRRFRPAAAAPRDGYWLSVARFADPRKNVRLLFRAYAVAKSRGVRLPRLVLAGSSGPSAADMAVAHDLGIGGDVDVRGAVSEDALPALYQGASLFLLPSDEEGWGLVLAEAMASGLPVVATRSDGAAEIVREEETGLLAPVGDHEALAARALEVLARPDAGRGMGAAGRRAAEERLSEEACGRRFVDAWRTLLATGRCARPESGA
jgi:glycosyltransferase involved in cell wall biosynthesis